MKIVISGHEVRKAIFEVIRRQFPEMCKSSMLKLSECPALQGDPDHDFAVIEFEPIAPDPRD